MKGISDISFEYHSHFQNQFSFIYHLKDFESHGFKVRSKKATLDFRGFI